MLVTGDLVIFPAFVLNRLLTSEYTVFQDFRAHIFYKVKENNFINCLMKMFYNLVSYIINYSMHFPVLNQLCIPGITLFGPIIFSKRDTVDLGVWSKK